MNEIDLYRVAANIRYHMISNIEIGKRYHIGGSLSIVDILVFLYYEYANINETLERDRVILSKGHCCYALYALLVYKGMFTEQLSNYCELGSIMQGHPDMCRNEFIDFSAGSLGQGLSVGVGMALGIKYMCQKSKVFVIVGDGELQEGQNWEAFMSAVKYNLDNLYCIIDYNKLQVDGNINEIMPLNNPENIFSLMGWQVQRVDGHDFLSIKEGVNRLDATSKAPKMLIADTVKGKGVYFMENNYRWHSKIISKEEKNLALKEIVKLIEKYQN